MTIWDYIHALDILLWLFTAASVFYVVVFSVASLFCRKPVQKKPTNKKVSFLILFPAYKEDKVIIHSVEECLKQDYPSDKFTVAVISDRMKDSTNEQLSVIGASLFIPEFEKSSKANALCYAMERTERTYDHVVILDADNVVKPDFLRQLNESCNQGFKAIQCHRCAKNNDNDIAALDGISEEINNTIFRKAHNAIGMSSALIGSGMCFDFAWFKENVSKLSTAVEDRELEALLMRQGIFIKYEEDIDVLDEKVSNKDNFQRQRLRWMTGQIQSLYSMMHYLPTAIRRGNINYIDKTLQQALIPRSILIVIITFFTVFMTIIIPVWCTKWWLLFFSLSISIFISIPKQLRYKSLGRISAIPGLAWRMMNNIILIDRKNTDFIHTKHESK